MKSWPIRVLARPFRGDDVVAEESKAMAEENEADAVSDEDDHDQTTLTLLIVATAPFDASSSDVARAA